MQKALLILFPCLLFSLSALSQVTKLENGSFEGEARDATIPQGWFACELGTTPDILPGYWGVYLESSDGDTYVGLITRDNGTWESIGQRLSNALDPENCYAISMDLAHSDTYSGYNQPIKLRIWGGENKCSRDQLFVETEIIDHTDWENYTFKFQSKKKVQYIIIEAFIQDGRFSHKGNILIDNISEIVPCERT